MAPRIKFLHIVAVLFASLQASCACGTSKKESPNLTPAAQSETQTAGFTSADCKRSGCSSQICTELGENIISTCQYREEYACYRSARCEKQANGQCGWTPSDALQSCISAATGK